ncbi:MAG: phosphoenolpyruvate carboxykinase [Oligoflexia bacterium]|nr:phosphoenolpyruvate carboxykinase [Oligoflexia bacterium]MBF0365090.1 phosphoenolpyruvate carboxykinase [Oligoflexia bacterium]
MKNIIFNRHGNQIIIHTDRPVCNDKWELLQSRGFKKILSLYLENLRASDSPLLEEINAEIDTTSNNTTVSIGPIDLRTKEGETELHQLLTTSAYERPSESTLAKINPAIVDQLINGLYDYWRSFDRFVVLHLPSGQRPYRAFNEIIESFTHIVRSTYRDMSENITGKRPRIYRQVAAGVNVGLITVPYNSNATPSLPTDYRETFADIPFIRQIWIDPPMIIDPPTNKRSGGFKKLNYNPFANKKFPSSEWICYPAQVGSLLVFIYFHEQFLSLGSALANLFELATDEQLSSGTAPDAILAYGVEDSNDGVAFYDDEKNFIAVGTVPAGNEFSYFGYLKKMVLTLHNVVMMKRGRLPFHGALLHIHMKNYTPKNVLIIGDTGAGKSESIEALRSLGHGNIRQIKIIADDMGSITLTSSDSSKEQLIGHGTEIGAFIRLDDLDQGHAFGQIDRSIIMNPQKSNSRIVIPVTPIEDVIKGYAIDIILYANNYESVDDDSKHPILERFTSPESALAVFSEGVSMSKGTTTATGLTKTYFANTFGPPEYQDLHQHLAHKFFTAAHKAGIVIGQLRTQLGIPGFERKGPIAAAKALLDLICNKNNDNN